MKNKLTIIGLAVLFFVSCTKKPTGVFSYTGSILGQSYVTNYDFRSDGKFYSEEVGVKTSGTWTVEGASIIAKFDSGNTNEFKWEGEDLVMVKSGGHSIDPPPRFLKK